VVSQLAQEETIRDLRRQIDGISREDEQEVIFRETSARKGRELLYRMIDGEPVPMRIGLARRAINMLDNRGNPKWTTHQELAPKWTPGEVKCFLHPEAPERAVLAEIGIPPVCETGNLRNGQAKRDHAEHCHKREWAAYNEYLSQERERVYNERQDKQLEATLKIAGMAAEPKPGIRNTPLPASQMGANYADTDFAGGGSATFSPALTCACGWDKGKNAASLGLHKRLHCPLRENASG